MLPHQPHHPFRSAERQLIPLQHVAIHGRQELGQLYRKRGIATDARTHDPLDPDAPRGGQLVIPATVVDIQAELQAAVFPEVQDVFRFGQLLALARGLDARHAPQPRHGIDAPALLASAEGKNPAEG